MSNSDVPSTLTAEEIGAAMAKAQELRVCTLPESLASGPNILPITEMQLAELLAVVYDHRESGATAALDSRINTLQYEINKLEDKRTDLADEVENLEQSERIRRAWYEIKPHIQDATWYRAAIAVAELDDALY